MIYQVVHVMVAYDEELATTAEVVYWLSPEMFCRLMVDTVSWRFEEEFNIRFTIICYEFWDSYDGIQNIKTLLQEAVSETGFYPGMTYNSIPIHILIAFTDQDTPLTPSYGYYEIEATKAVIVKETYYMFSLGQCTDNVLQHELSHLYKCSHHNELDCNCVMNIHKVYLNIIEGEVPYALTTDEWCDICKATIEANRRSYGSEETIGEGPGSDGPIPQPYGVDGVE